MTWSTLYNVQSNLRKSVNRINFFKNSARFTLKKQGSRVLTIYIV
jgi:hypothetical protein